MFKKLLQSLTRSTPAAPPPAKAPATPAPKQPSLLDKVGAGKPAPAPPPPPVAKAAKAPEKPAAPAKPRSPEEMCGITAKMSKDEIRAQLKLLYRRFNRSASSLDAKTRGEADAMLDAIVTVREKTFGEI